MTPLRRQYLEVKQKHPEAILLFQIGDFYEAFDEDAHVVSRELGIALTSKRMGKGLKVPLAGVPCHTVQQYLGKLIGKGYKVAICDQLTPPGKKLIRRDVTRIITPGTVVEPTLLDGKRNNYLASIVFQKQRAAIAYVDITTSEFATTQLDRSKAVSELERLKPSEILLPLKDKSSDFKFPASITYLQDGCFNLDRCRQTLLDHFHVDSLKAYGCDHLPLAIQAAGGVLHYLSKTQELALKQLTGLTTYSPESFMLLDPQTLSNLEIFQSSLGVPSGSLLSVMDLTKTPMGGRLLRKWMSRPLLDIEALTKRQDMVEWFYKNPSARGRFQNLLGGVFDLERLINRVKSGIVTPRELIVLGCGLQVLPRLRSLTKRGNIARQLLKKLKTCDDVVELIAQAIVEDPPPSLDSGGVIKDGYSEELDRLRSLLKSSKKYLADLEARERARSKIKSLKVNYNKVFGYYIEVTKPNLHLVPDGYVRKQTLVSAERFITLELKEHESLVSNARTRMAELEFSLFQQVCAQVGERRGPIMSIASALAQLDVVSSLAEVAARHNYTRPHLTEEAHLIIKNGRHPVVEQSLKPRNSFVPNDTCLSSDQTQILILTGSNMSGKSTHLRQVALITLLGQIGSFVPADSATIGIVDRIFTRVGLQDHLTVRQSSFMLEMMETAHILNNATAKSLIILDEVGRGTSTYDGLSIARAIVEFIHNHPKARAKTLFATHYHELTELEDTLPRAKNYHMAVKEDQGKIIFLWKVTPGRADKSYGIQVAKLAGLPQPVLHRAQELLSEYNASGYINNPSSALEVPAVHEAPSEYGSLHSPVIDDLLKLDVDSMTPIEALTKLYELKKKAERSS